MPYFSIIVASFNAASCIAETISSVLNQSYTDFEIVVKDALSTDNTLKTIPIDPRIKVVSCKDSGIYDGMNQGIEQAEGEYICFLNCGDTFSNPKVLEQIHRMTQDYNELAIYYGNYHTKGSVTNTPKIMTKSFLYRRPICHQTMFFSRRLFDQFGLYDTEYRILSDYEFTLRCFTAGIPFIHSGQIICEYLGDGYSTKNMELYKKESKTIKRKYYSKRDITLYELRDHLLLQSFRRYLASDRSPRTLRNLYRRMSNVVNR